MSNYNHRNTLIHNQPYQPLSPRDSSFKPPHEVFPSTMPQTGTTAINPYRPVRVEVRK